MGSKRGTVRREARGGSGGVRPARVGCKWPRTLPRPRWPRHPRLRPLPLRAPELAAASEVPGPGPGREEQKHLRAAVARHRVALVRLEVGEGASGSLDVAVGARDLHGALDDEEPGVLLHLVVAELLARIEADEDRPCLVLALQDDRRAGARRSLDLG